MLQMGGDAVTGFVEKPEGDGGWINGGFFVLEPSVIDLVDDDATPWEGAPMERLVKAGELDAYKHFGFWQPMDTLRDKHQLEQLWQEGRAPWRRWLTRDVEVAVTGASGFIGRHVVAELERRSVPSVLVARRPLESSVGPTVQVDLSAPAADLFDRLGSPRSVLHLAWDGLPNYLSDDHVTKELPAQGRLLSVLLDAGLSSLVVAGTCLEYGMRSGELREDMPPAPAVPYANAKDRLHRRLQSVQQATPFALTWARLFYTFGTGQAPSSLYSQLRAAAERGDDHFDMSGGAQVRDYLPVGDVAAALVDLALLRRDIGVVNVCSGRPVTVSERVAQWIDENGWSITPRLGVYPYPTYEPMAFWGSPAKLCSILGSRGR